MLSARALGTVGIDAAVALVDLDLDLVVDHRVDPNRRKRRMPPRLAVERRDADQPMNTRLGLQPAIGVVPLDEHSGALDAGFFTIMNLEQLDLVAMLLGPARVHAQEHVGPVLVIGAAGA